MNIDPYMIAGIVAASALVLIVATTMAYRIGRELGAGEAELLSAEIKICEGIIKRSDAEIQKLTALRDSAFKECRSRGRRITALDLRIVELGEEVAFFQGEIVERDADRDEADRTESEARARYNEQRKVRRARQRARERAASVTLCKAVSEHLDGQRENHGGVTQE
jgi:hypothetical protein